MQKTVAQYEQIIIWIKTRIEEGELKSGDRLESEHQLCSRFQVSRQTVRHALKVLTQEGFIERRQGSGTYIREHLGQQEENNRTMQVAVITTFVQEYIFSAIIQEIEHELFEADYGMQISFTNNSIEKERMILKNILEKRMVDGIIAETTKSALPNPNLDLYRELMKRNIPVVFINSCYPGLHAPYVSLDDKEAGKIVTEYLIECGHQQIGALFKSDDKQGHLRYAGYVESLIDADLRIPEEHIIWIDTEEIRNLKKDADLVLKRLEGCTACICYNDEVASNLVSACLERGIRIPEDFSVIGIDDSELANYCEVPLTSAKNPIRELGKIAAHEILHLMKGLPVPKQMKLSPELIKRSSVARIEMK